jgi:hypothetical protein
VWKTTVESDRPQTTIRRMRIACCVLKATNTHSQYVILIAFPLQQWLHERASMLRDTYIVSLIVKIFATSTRRKLLSLVGDLCFVWLTQH